MVVIPAIDLLDGHAVRLVARDPQRALTLGHPLDLLQRYAAAGAPLLQLTDLSGVLDIGAEHDEFVEQMARVVPVQVRSGRNDAESLTRAIDAGVARVVVELSDLADPAMIEAVPRHQLLVALDFCEGSLCDSAGSAPGLPTVIERLHELGIRRVLCSSVDREGTMSGPGFDDIQALAGEGLSVVASGGVGNLEHLRALQRQDVVEAVVVGKALASRCFTYKEAMAVS